MKRLIIVTFCLITMMAVFADSSNPFTTLFQRHFPVGSFAYKNENNIKGFVGDSIYFDIQGKYGLSNISVEEPDTIWLKEKRPRKPKERKDYILCYNYKGVQTGESFITPYSEFNGKTFGLHSVKKIYEGPYQSTVGYELTLVEPETVKILHVALTPSTLNGGEWRMYSKKTNAKINDLKGHPLYLKESYGSKITPYQMISGELYLKLHSIAGSLYADPNAEFELTSTEASPMYLRYYSNNLSYDLVSTKFVTEAEYQKQLEKTRVYQINHELPADSTTLAAMNCLPFSILIGYVDSHSAYVSQKITPDYSPLGYTTLPYGTDVFIGDKIKVRGEEYYKAAAHGKAFFIECSNVNFVNSEKLDTLLSKPQEVRDAFLDYAKLYSRCKYLEERIEKCNEAKKLSKRGIIVTEARPYDESEYTAGTGMNFEVVNTSNKTIKYITFNFIGYNAVNDPVSSRGKTLLTCRGIGPIEPFESSEYQYEYVWFTDIVDSAKLRSIVVQYTNGTSKTFTGEALQIVDKDVLEAPTKKSPISDFLPLYDEDKE